VLKWIVPTLLALAARAEAQVAAPPVAAKTDAAAELKAQCAKIAERKSYSFDSSLENDAPAPGGGQRDDTPVAGKVEIGGVAELKRGDIVAYRKGEKLACKKKDTWELFNADAAPKGGGGGRGGRYGGGGGGSEAKEHLALRSLATMTLPHELLATLDANVHDVKSTGSDGKHTYTATLTDSAAMEFSEVKELNGAMARGSGGGGKGGGGGNGGGPFKATGTATIVFGKDGNVEKFVIETQVKNKTNDYKQKHSFTMRDWGAAKFTAPKDAASLLGA
jgi:hypothetical protein